MRVSAAAMFGCQVISEQRRDSPMKMNRVFLKLSGEALAGPKKTGFDEDTVKEVARQVKLLLMRIR